MAKYRKNRINDAMTAECAQIVREIKDPRVSGVMITVMNSDVSADLKYAKIYYSVLGECDDRELARGLKSAAPFVRSRLAERLNLRITPEVTFVKDDGVRHGAEISKILKQIVHEDEPSENDGGIDETEAADDDE